MGRESCVVMLFVVMVAVVEVERVGKIVFAMYNWLNVRESI